MMYLIIAVLVSLVLGAVTASLHIALRDVSRGKIRSVSRDRESASIRSICEHQDEHALAMSLVRVVCMVVLVGSSLLLFTGFGEESRVTISALLWAALVSGTLTYLMMHVLATSLAEHVGPRMIVAFALPVHVGYVVLGPLVRVMRVVDVVVQRLAGVDDENNGSDELEREILSVVSEGESEGSIAETERDMIEAVVDLRGTSVSEIMTPRTEVEGIELTNDIEAIKAFIESAGHSRIPVYEGDLDHIVGILYAKDLLPFVGHDVSNFELRGVLREAWFVPETKPVTELLQESKTQKVHLSIVLDEYGGTAGLITIEDIVEEIVGELRDEYEPADETEPEIAVEPTGASAEIDARAYLDDVNDTLEDLGHSLPESEDYDTIGGLVTTHLGRIPETGETFCIDTKRFTVLDAEPTRVRRIKIEFGTSDDEGGASGSA
ncbi:MAG: hemolysin family protein [Phycisphaerales bacterium JB043]